MPRPSNKALRRSQIVHSLMKIMSQRGYQKSSTKEVAAAAGLTQGLIHYHFRNKKEILLAVLQELTSVHDKSLAEKLAFSKEPIDQLGAFIDFHLGLGSDANEENLSCWIVLSEEAMRDEDISHGLEAAIASMIKSLIEIIETGKDQDKLGCEDPQAAAAAIMATIQGYFLLSATTRGQIPRGSAAKTAKLMVEGLLKTVQPIPHLVNK